MGTNSPRETSHPHLQDSQREKDLRLLLQLDPVFLVPTPSTLRTHSPALFTYHALVTKVMVTKMMVV